MAKKKRRLYLWLVVLAALCALVYLGLPRPKGARPAHRPRHEKAVVKRAPEAHAPPHAVAPAPAPAARLSIIIDDMGQDMRALEDILAMKLPISVAVLPCQRRSRDIALRAEGAGLDVLLHLPMQPREKRTGLGGGALMEGMGGDEIKSTVSSDLAGVPGAGGVNNHMGSGLTEDRDAMRALMEAIKARGLYFVDSRTSPASLGYSTAEEMGVKAASRDVFLDNTSDPDEIKGQLDKAVRLARRRGYAVAIGHPRPATLGVLKEALPGLRGEGVELVRVSSLVK